MDIRRKEILRCFGCGISSVIRSFTNKGYSLLHRHKKHALAMFYFALEAISFALDQLEKKKWCFLLIAFLLAAFVSTTVTYVHIKDRISATAKSQAKRQLGVLEVVFSILQLVPVSIDFTVGVLGINVNYTIPCVFPLAFAMVAIVFVFRKDENTSNQLPYHKKDLSSREDLLSVEPPQSESEPTASIEIAVTKTNMTPADPLGSTSTPTEVDLSETTMRPANQNDSQLRSRFQLMKVLIKISMNDQKSRSKAMKIAAVFRGVESLALKEEDKSLMEVIGDGIDVVELTALLRKKFGYAEIISVTPFICGLDGNSRVEIQETSEGDEKRDV